MAGMLTSTTHAQTVHWLLMTVVALFIVTGFGVSEFRTVERLTLGLLTKQLARAFKIHFELRLPLVVLLMLHVYLVLSKRIG